MTIDADPAVVGSREIKLRQRSLGEIVSTILVILALYCIGLAVYRLTLHPLASFPGPRIGALTKYYEFYYDVLKAGGGRYTFKIQELHARYGPIVRINPDELHCDAAEFYETLYAGRGEIRDKYAPAAGMAGTPLGIFGTTEHHIHSKRRGAINKLFSKRIVNAKSAIIGQKLGLLCQRLEEEADDLGVVELRAKFLAFATDVVCEFGLGASPHGELLLDRKAQASWQKTIYALEDLTPLVKQFYQGLPVAFVFPSWVFRPFFPDLCRLKAMHEGMHAMAANFLQTKTIANEDRIEEPKGSVPRSIFEEIWNSSLSDAEKSVDRLAQEGLVLIAAGGETVSRVLCVATYHLLANEHLTKKLTSELDEARGFEGTEVCLTVVEALPFLSAVIKESLRLAAVISSRLPLVCPNKELIYGRWRIPAGVAISMTPAHLLLDPRCFENPLSFDPERWLRSDAHREKAEKYFLPFSRGSRMCLGINLAYAELFMVVATLFRRYDMRLSKTSRERDIDHSHDCFVGKPMASSNGVHVTVEQRR